MCKLSDVVGHQKGQMESTPKKWRELTASSYRWTGWVWEITGWGSSRLQENHPSV